MIIYAGSTCLLGSSLYRTICLIAYCRLLSTQYSVLALHLLLHSVASIRIYFAGAKFFPSRGGRSFGQPEARGAETEARRAESGVGFLGRGQRAPPHQLGGPGERCKLTQRGPVRSPGKFEIWCYLRPQNSLQKSLIMYKLLQKG